MNERQVPGYAPQIFIPPAAADSVVWRLEGADVTASIEHRLKGEFLKKTIHQKDGQNIEYEEWISDKKARVMNDTGAKAIVTAADIIFNKITFLSNITDDELLDQCREMHRTIAREIYNNWSRFDVHQDPSPVLNQIMTLIFFAMKRAQGAGERESLTKMESINRIIAEGQKSGGFPFFGRGQKKEGES